MNGTATFSMDERYRYNLTRVWDEDLPEITFIGLNPSTADAETNDPTVRRCIGFAQGWGYGKLNMLNIFAFRATDPKDMKAAEEPVGPMNNFWIAKADGPIVAAWGGHGSFHGRDVEVMKLLGDDHRIWCLGVTKAGSPHHPLYLPAKTMRQPFEGRPV